MHACYLIVSSKNKTRWLPNVSQAYIKFLRNFIGIKELICKYQKEEFTSDKKRWVPDVTPYVLRKINYCRYQRQDVNVKTKFPIYFVGRQI